MSTPWIIVPIEIRDGVFVRLQLPPDITPAEADKVARVVKAYGSPVETVRGMLQDTLAALQPKDNGNG